MNKVQQIPNMRVIYSWLLNFHQLKVTKIYMGWCLNPSQIKDFTPMEFTENIFEWISSFSMGLNLAEAKSFS